MADTTTDRTNVTNSGYSFGGQNYQNETRTDSQGNQYTVAIPVSSLTSTTPVTVATPQYNTSGQKTDIANLSAYTSSALDQANLAEQQAQAEKTSATSTLANLQSSLGNKASDLATAYKESGVTDLAAQLRKLNAQSQALGLDTQAKTLEEQNKATGQNITSAAVQRNIADVTRENTINTARIAMQSAIAKADYDTAKDAADTMINAKYDKILADIEAKKTNLDLIKDNLTTAQKKRADEQTRLLDKQKEEETQKREDEKNAQTLALTVSKNLSSLGRTPSEISKITNSILNAKTFTDKVIAASPYLQSAEDKADLSYKIAQTAKIYNDIRNDAITNGSSLPSQMTLAYAQEYAATGKIPTGVNSKMFGAISNYAKELPKQNGEIVSTATGVKPAQDSTYADALSSLSSVVKLAQDLKTQDKERIGGLVGGTLGYITGSEPQAKYISTRSQIVDLLSRARSGAALTENEVKTYSDMLPSRFSEKFGLGVNSDVQIQNFIDAITKDMQNKANAKGWSIYGVSKVKLGGDEYTVGDIIQANGRTGRINADGSITLIQ